LEVLINRPNPAARPMRRLDDNDVSAGVDEVDCRSHASHSGADDHDPHLREAS
jgi:hypothetical protein